MEIKHWIIVTGLVFIFSFLLLINLLPNYIANKYLTTKEKRFERDILKILGKGKSSLIKIIGELDQLRWNPVYINIYLESALNKLSQKGVVTHSKENDFIRKDGGVFEYRIDTYELIENEKKE
jgi:hypothetical protein